MQISTQNEKNLIGKRSYSTNNSNSNKSISALKMKTACFSETLLAINETTHFQNLGHNKA
jgi:hypothetical protein